MNIYRTDAACPTCGKVHSKSYVFKDKTEEIEMPCQKCGKKLIIKLIPVKEN